MPAKNSSRRINMGSKMLDLGSEGHSLSDTFHQGLLNIVQKALILAVKCMNWSLKIPLCNACFNEDANNYAGCKSVDFGRKIHELESEQWRFSIRSRSLWTLDTVYKMLIFAVTSLSAALFRRSFWATALLSEQPPKSLNRQWFCL